MVCCSNRYYKHLTSWLVLRAFTNTICPLRVLSIACFPEVPEIRKYESLQGLQVFSAWCLVYIDNLSVKIIFVIHIHHLWRTMFDDYIVLICWIVTKNKQKNNETKNIPSCVVCASMLDLTIQLAWKPYINIQFTFMTLKLLISIESWIGNSV